jgi:inner membrane protein COX18
MALTTIALRAVFTLPLMAYSYNNAAKLELLQPEIKSIAIQLRTEVAMAKSKLEWSDHIAKQQYRANMKRLVRNLYERDNCHPMKDYILPWIQIPLWISMSLALRNMAGAVIVDGQRTEVLCPELATEGTLWFSNLLLPDATFLLPLIMCLSNLVIIEMHNLRLTTPTKFQRLLTYSMRGMMLIMFPIATSVPSCMCYYWTCSSLYGLGQNLLLRLPRIRRILHIAHAPSESATPFRDLWHAARKKYTRAGKDSSHKETDL